MSKEMIISVNGREKKIAILDNGKVTEFYIERGEENSGIAGNIYKGRVQRVLPGMQSAFVSIGLERDAFLYVSDFFDEEEEIERIVMEKGKKTSPEEAKREANDRIERARIEREKAMESAQEIAEPIAESGITISVDEKEVEETDRRGRSRRGRERKPRFEDEVSTASEPEAEELNFAEPPVIEFDDSGFERISDDEDTGELFKDAFRQEAIIDKVRAVEFDMEESSIAEVGSLLSSVSATDGGFERIADEDEVPVKETKKKSSRSRSKKADGEETSEKKSRPKKAASSKPKKSSSRSKKAAEAETPEGEPEEQLPDSEASVREKDETSAMSVRRGGRGRRRGGKGRKKQAGDTTDETTELEVQDESSENGNGDIEISDPEIIFDADPEPEPEVAEVVLDEVAETPEPSNPGNREPRERDNRGRDKRRDGRGRDRDGQQREGKKFDRNDRHSRDDRGERGDRGERRGQPTISDLLREGQEILVQIAKEPIAKKGARITSHIALPGRFLVYMPTIEHVGVSRKIESSSERGRLRTLIQRIRQEEDVPSGGFIVRTAGIGISEEDLRQDARYLVRTWVDIKKSSEKAKSPAMVHQDLDLVQRLLRDQLSDDFAAIRVDSEEEYLRTVEFINRIQPKLVNRVKFYTRDEPILEAYNVQEEIDKALKPRVWLKSGGYLVINQTEALVAIDVNTGKFVGKGNARLEDTIVKTNLEAVDEIARQIRLRDLGGIIVLDLIDMEDRRNRHKVSQALQEALASDKSPTKVLSFNDFGLIIMTRKRVKQSLERTMCAPCEYCEGAGWVKSPSTVCYEVLAEARRLSKHQEDVRQTTLRVHPDVAKALRSTERSVLEEIEEYLGFVDVTADPHIHQAQFDFAFV
ncbi:MAG: Rne/Rng family ribonuclease [Pyrinomonadaceae bacterium]|nr:Rne/Rng family ribonuclease [Pyrinomonadaceae bacterium]